MSDREMEALFASGRAQAAGRIRVPGADAARRTVRRRRQRAGVAAAACAVLVTLAGTATLSRRPAPVPPATPVAGAVSALHAPGTRVIEETGPAEIDYTREYPAYAGNLTLEVACAGDGRLTFVAESTPDQSLGQSARVEWARVTAPCASAPTSVTTLFAVGRAARGLTVRLDDLAAQGTTTFAYRITSDTHVPVESGDAVNTLTAALGAEPTGNVLRLEASVPYDDPHPFAAGDYRLAVACAGTGTIGVRVGSGEEQTVACGWPPQRAVVSGTTEGADRLTVTFRPADGGVAPALVAWAVL
ncbi:hypothetical protein [Catenuloplanes japonicus]|uniref:hypothetical protein n=1 Tax=Catenuloplanes japonicus TaxID=33876 RepID=UPI0005257859|nr:hypothetical protein [Catenuloplanes japonicus]